MSGCEDDQPESDLSVQFDKMGVANMSDSNDKKLVDVLLDFSDTCHENENYLDVVDFHQVESLQPWQSVAPVPRYLKPSYGNKKRKPDESNYDVDDKQRYYKRYTNPKADRETTAWKDCVEPTTYRYMPNNGTYRASKLEPKISLTHSSRPPPRKPCEKLSPEQKQLQREIQKELRKEYESSSQASAESHSVHDSVDTLQLLSLSDTTNLNSNKSSANVSPQPIASAVSYKSASDRIFENFASRISSLDEEMKNDIRLYKKWEESITKTARSRSEPNSSRRRDSSKSLLRSDTSQQQPKPVLSYEELAKAKPVFHHDDSKLTVTNSRLKNRFENHTKKKKVPTATLR